MDGGNDCLAEKKSSYQNQIDYDKEKITLLGIKFDKVNDKNVDELTDQARDQVMVLLKETVRPEFLNRVDEIIMFQPLLKKDIQSIVRIQLNELKKMVGESGINLNFTDYVIEYLTENGFDIQFGARPLKRFIQKQIVNQLSKKILEGSIDKSKPVLVDVFDQTVVFRNE